MRAVSWRRLSPRFGVARAYREPTPAPVAAPSSVRISLVSGRWCEDWERRKLRSWDQWTSRREYFVTGAVVFVCSPDASLERHNPACWRVMSDWTRRGSDWDCPRSRATSSSCSVSSANFPDCSTASARHMSHPFSVANYSRYLKLTRSTGDSVRVWLVNFRSQCARLASEYRNCRRRTRAMISSTGSYTARDCWAGCWRTTSTKLLRSELMAADRTSRRRRTSVGLSPKKGRGR